MRNSHRFIVAGMGGLLASSFALDVCAQSYPEKLIRVIVPRSPGGGSDIIARLLAPGMQKVTGQTFLIENRPDAAAVAGAELASRATPDGYTVFLADNAFYQNPAIT